MSASPLADEITENNSRLHTVLRHRPLPSDVQRIGAFWANQSLVIIYHVKRWHWNEFGIYSFLNFVDRNAVATTCYSAHMEHMERVTDDELVLSPTQQHGDLPIRHA